MRNTEGLNEYSQVSRDEEHSSGTSHITNDTVPSYQNSEADSRSNNLPQHMSIDDATHAASPPHLSFSASVRLFLGRAVFAIFIGLVLLVIFSNNLSHRKGTTNINGADSPSVMTLKGRSTVEDLANGAVASDNKLCSDVGLTILRERGGNAIDSAVATVLCLGVVNPASSGIGGGAFILIHGDRSTHEYRTGLEDYAPPPFEDERDSQNEDRRQTSSKSSGKVTEVIDCREQAPGAATAAMFKNLSPNDSIFGGLAIGVPGELRGLELAHSRHGSLPWPIVVEPAMKLARDGFPVGNHLAHDIADNWDKIMQFQPLAKLLSKNNKGISSLKEGDILKNPKLASTLNAVIERGADAIYTGERAKHIAEDIQNAGGIITYSDLANYRPVLRSPLISRDIMGFNVVGTPPPSSGGAAVIGALRFLAEYSMPLASLADTVSKHRFVEACRHVFAIRMSLSDPHFFSNTTKAAVSDLVSGSYMKMLKDLSCDDTVLNMSEYGGKRWAQLHNDDGNGTLVDAHEGDRRRMTPHLTPYSLQENESKRKRKEYQTHRRTRLFGYLNDHGTTHLSVVDKEFNAVSITSTVNTYFGSNVLSQSSGIILNNQMDDFSNPGRPNYFGLRPSESNYVAPHKRPLSSMSPTIIFRSESDSNQCTKKNINEDIDGYEQDLGRLFLVLGASGGPKIITSVLQTIINYALLGMPLYESVVHPRVHDQLLYHGQAATTVEACPLIQGPTIVVTNRTKAALRKRGHQLLDIDYAGTVQAVAIDLETSRLSAASDVRKGGSPAGY
eukprot:scaffold52289_cov51-Attheya_sp.AAC.2